MNKGRSAPQAMFCINRDGANVLTHCGAWGRGSGGVRLAVRHGKRPHHVPWRQPLNWETYMRLSPAFILAAMATIAFSADASAQSRSQTPNTPGTDHSRMQGMDHSNMPGMDHSSMPRSQRSAPGQDSGSATTGGTPASEPSGAPRPRSN